MPIYFKSNEGWTCWWSSSSCFTPCVLNEWQSRRSKVKPSGRFHKDVFEWNMLYSARLESAADDLPLTQTHTHTLPPNTRLSSLTAATVLLPAADTKNSVERPLTVFFTRLTLSLHQASQSKKTHSHTPKARSGKLKLWREVRVKLRLRGGNFHNRER